MKIGISVDSAIDLSKKQVELFDVNVVPFSVLLGDELGEDGVITPSQIIEYVSKTKVLPKTSAINEAQFDEHFENLLTKYDAIIHVSLSSELSSACQNACNSAKKFKNVYVVDSLHLSSGIALLVLYIKKLIDSGKYEPATIVEMANNKRDKICTSFVVTRLDYLYKGGRCNSLVYFGANLLHICPQIIVQNGKMQTGKKFRGNYEDVVNKYKAATLADMKSPDLENVFLTYTTADESLIASVEKDLYAYGFKNVYICQANAVITSHCGEKCLGILYAEND